MFTVVHHAVTMADAEGPIDIRCDLIGAWVVFFLLSTGISKTGKLS